MLPATLLPPPLSPDTQGPDLERFLRQFYNLTIHGSGPYVHPRAISFRNEQDKVNWIPYMPDASSRDTIPNFAGPSPKYKKKTWIGLLCVPNGTISGNQWISREWHAFVVAIISGERQKYILIWDCDPNLLAVARGERFRNVCFGKQRSIIEYLRKCRHMETAEVWYNIDDSNSGKNKCLELSLCKIQEWANLGDFGYLGTEDPRFHNCVKLKL